MKEIQEKRYALEISQQEVESTREAIKSASLKLILENIDKMKVTPNRAQGMAYFDKAANLFSQREQEIRAYKDAGGKVIGTFCTFVPSELIYAVGAIPIRLCSGCYDTVGSGEEILPNEVCPIVKSSLGDKIVGSSPYFELCDVVISPGTCDAKTKLGEILEDYLPVWMMDVPHAKDKPQSKSFWIGEVTELKRKLEKFSGEKVSRKSLRSAIELVSRAQKAFCRLHEARKAKVPVITGRDAMLVTQALFNDDIKRWTEKTGELCNELDEHAAIKQGVCDPDAPRIMLVGSPIIWPNWKLPNLIEEGGAIVVCDELCSGVRSLYDPVRVDEWTMDDMLVAIGERYLLPSTCPCFTPNNNRANLLLQMAEDFKVQGVIYHILRGCHTYSIEFMRIKRVLERRNIPILRLETEHSQEDVGQIKTRIEAFLEMVKESIT